MWDLFVRALGLIRFLSGCAGQALGCVGSVVCSMRALSLRRVSSVVVARGLSCSMACGILVPRPGIEPASTALEGSSLPLDHQGSPLLMALNNHCPDGLFH